MSTTKSNIVKKKALREAQLDTLEKIASVVGETAGPAGSYVMILNEASNNVFTKDGHKVLSNIKFLQPLERSIMEEVNSSTGYTALTRPILNASSALSSCPYILSFAFKTTSFPLSVLAKITEDPPLFPYNSGQYK